METIPITVNGAKVLEDELLRLKDEVRPRIVNDISTAREHGDLKENSEYKMARQDQDILLSRKNELEVDLSRARVTDFTEASNGLVGIGSIVDLKEGSTGKKHQYAILGAWDSDPKNNILSYKTPLAQQLLGKEKGATAATKIGGNEEEWTIVKISRLLDKK